MAETKITLKHVGLAMAIAGLGILVFNAADYLSEGNGNTPSAAVGIVLALIGAGIYKKSRNSNNSRKR